MKRAVQEPNDPANDRQPARVLEFPGRSDEDGTASRPVPNMPARNPWLADSVFPIAHSNSAATNSIAHAGPARGRRLTDTDVTSIPNLYTHSATVKEEEGVTIVIAAGIDGLRKINAAGDALRLVSFLPYPGVEELFAKATPEALDTVLAKVDAAAMERDEAGILALAMTMADLGFTNEQLANGAHNLIDKDGFHYANFGGLKIIKTTDDNDSVKPLHIVQVKDLSQELPAELARKVTAITGFGMTYDGHLAVITSGALFLLDRDFNVKGILPFPGEAVENSICTDEAGIYLVTSRRMLKVVWTGTKLSSDDADGGWEAEVSGGSGTTPTLMGFGGDRDKLVIIADGDPRGTNAVAFWRDTIPERFTQKPGAKSRRIADQIAIGISKATVDVSPNVLGYGALFLSCRYPQPAADNWGNAMTSGVTRPAPTGAQKLEWNTATKSFEKSWHRNDIDNTDLVRPVVSAATGKIYFTSKQDGYHEHVALDWETGEPMARWRFPDNSRRWNAYGSGTIVLENGDVLLGGLFALKRVKFNKSARILPFRKRMAK